MPEIAFVNGEFMPLADAVIPIEDRGFQYADGVYEVVSTYGGQPYAMEAHLQRLERSLRELRIVLDLRSYGLEGIIREGIERSGFSETLVYVQITRGVGTPTPRVPGARRRAHRGDDGQGAATSGSARLRGRRQGHHDCRSALEAV